MVTWRTRKNRAKKHVKKHLSKYLWTIIPIFLFILLFYTNLIGAVIYQTLTPNYQAFVDSKLATPSGDIAPKIDGRYYSRILAERDFISIICSKASVQRGGLLCSTILIINGEWTWTKWWYTVVSTRNTTISLKGILGSDATNIDSSGWLQAFLIILLLRLVSKVDGWVEWLGSPFIERLSSIKSWWITAIYLTVGTIALYALIYIPIFNYPIISLLRILFLGPIVWWTSPNIGFWWTYILLPIINVAWICLLLRFFGDNAVTRLLSGYHWWGGDDSSENSEGFSNKEKETIKENKKNVVAGFEAAGELGSWARGGKDWRW